jgi:hypothetical protein
LVPGNLTVGGVSFASLQFTAVEPLRKVVNLQTGAIELRVDTDQLNPFWVAGMIDSSGNILVSKGRVAFTTSLESVGNRRVTFASPHPNGANFVVQLQSIGVYKWVDQLTSSSFLAVMRTSGFANQNQTLFFSVLA